jgi:hypothetical protein
MDRVSGRGVAGGGHRVYRPRDSDNAGFCVLSTAFRTQKVRGAQLWGR